jgi:polysaccharide biosynthesis/export protein
MATSRTLHRSILSVALLAMAGAAAAQETLKIAVRDQLVVTVLGAPDYSGKFQVDPDGMFEYPKLGRVKADGLTAADVAGYIKKELAAKVFNNPQVIVELEQSAHMHVFVTGEVRQSAPVAFAGEIRVLEALIRAGSVTENAGEEAIIVRARPLPGQAENTPTRVDIHALLAGDMTDNLPLKDGDTLIVPKAEPVYVTGYVKNPGQYRLRKGMTVGQAIILAGDVTDQGNKKKITISRPVAGQTEPKKIQVSLTDLIQAGDTINVPRGIW